ncbi:hypothetical protein [Streptomyces sp. NPDC000618]|uniref:hypothetical protein n=1 Tax=Streptomyces sp. NPDC000618 TaxID=3154265 RepID=UPI003329DD9D
MGGIPGLDLERFTAGQVPERWVFGDRDSGRYLAKFSWTKIVRHQMVKGNASVDDPALAGYWAERRRKHKPVPAYACEPSGLA